MPKNKVWTLVNKIQQVTIEYLTYLMLNIKKLDNKQLSALDKSPAHIKVKEPTLREDGSTLTVRLG